MKTIITLLALIGLSGQVQAASYIEECKQVAVEKLKAQAASNEAIFDEASVELSALDARWYNPSKYVWFQARAVKFDGTEIRLETLTQKSYIPPQKCF